MADNKKNTITSKLLDLLSKTKDALIADLETEFISVREAIEKAEETNSSTDKDTLFNLENKINGAINIVDAVFAKVGYDISHYENLNELKKTVISLVGIIDGIAKDIKDVVEKSESEGLNADNVADFLEAILPHIQSILKLIKDLSDTEWNEVEKECGAALVSIGEKAESQFLTKDFARRILDHILITLLKNAKDVFSDEIEFVRMSANQFTSGIVDEFSKVKENAYSLGGDLKKEVNALLNETLTEYNDIKDRIAKNISELQNVKLPSVDDIKNYIGGDSYEKLARAFSITYSILDFLGVVREKRITLKLPNSFKGIIEKVEKGINQGGSSLENVVNNLSNKIESASATLNTEIGEAQDALVNAVQDASTLVSNETTKLIESMDKDLQITKELTGLSVSAIGAVNNQLNLLYNESEGLVDKLNKRSAELCQEAVRNFGGANLVISGICTDVTSQLEEIKNFTYPINIVTIDWSSIEMLFTRPIKHFKSLYPINNVDDAENLMRRIMGILHQLNSDIPDFDSLRCLLESLLKKLQKRMMILIGEIKDNAEEEIKKIKKAFQPIITTIRRVIEILREIAIALKNRLYTVLNDVKGELTLAMNNAEDIINDVLDDIKKINFDTQGEEIKAFFSNVDKTIEKIGHNAESAVQGVGESTSQYVDSLTEEWLEAQRRPNINLPEIVQRTLVEPVMNCVADIIYNIPSIKLKNPIPLSTIYALHGDIMALQTQVGKGFEVEGKKIWISDFLPSTLVSVEFPSLDITDEAGRIIETQLQAWSYSVLSSIKSVTSPSTWEKRMNSIVTQLQAEFQNDLKNITGLMSKDGINRLLEDSSSVKKQLAKNLQITDYITIIQNTLSDVILPNPEYFFDSLKQVLSNIITELICLVKEKIDKVNDYIANVKKQINAIGNIDSSQIEERIKSELGKIGSCADKITQRAIEIWNNILDLINNIKEYIKELEEYFNDKKENVVNKIKNTLNSDLTKLRDQVKDYIKTILSNLAGEVWERVKAEIISPILNFIKERISYIVRKYVKSALFSEINKIMVIDPAIIKTLNIPSIYELNSAICNFKNNIPALRDKTDLSEIVEYIQNNKNTIQNNSITIVSSAENLCDELKNKSKEEWGSIIENVIKNKQIDIVAIPSEFILWMYSLVKSSMEFVQSDMKGADIIKLVVAIYKGIPDEIKDPIKNEIISIKDKIADILPSLPSSSDGFLSKLGKNMSCNYDLDNKFCNVTLLDLKTKEKDKDKLNASLLIQLFMFVGTYGKDDDKDSTSSYKEINKNNNDEVKVVGGEDDEDDDSNTAIYFMIYLGGNLSFNISIGEKHLLKIEASGNIGEEVQSNDPGVSSKSIGFCLTPKTDENPSYFHGFGSTKSLGGLFSLCFERKEEGKDDKLSILKTKYVDINIRNYRQMVYALYNTAYPVLVKEHIKNLGDKVDGFTAGYYGSIEDFEFVLKIRQNEFFKSFLKDDISSTVQLFLLYDYKKGFQINGGLNCHFDIDCDNLKLGSLTLHGLGLDFGSSKFDWGTFEFQIGSIFDLNFGPIAFSFENLGIGFDLNFIKPDFSLGDWDFSSKFKFPTGIGISLDTDVVKGSGLISYDTATGELMGCLDINVINKFGISAFVLADLGTVEGHSFSFVALISTHFNPGIPLGMGFSLTGIGGCLGLMRMIDRQAVTTAVRQGTLGSVFFVENLKEHLSEMKASAMAIFPYKKDQFFVGLLGQISYSPVLSCDFGLMLQLPNPTEIIIVGSLKVSISGSSVIRINVLFAGGINFKEGMWFDASIIDSEIVGIKLEGDMSFRLFWGGQTKGFLLSIGGFHPCYNPEPGMLVSGMKRLSMKLDYGILYIGLQTYLAITSNSFQIGARLDLKIGWKKFGITGYAGFDALFQFDPFMFMFDAECGVAVRCGSWKLMSIDLSLKVSGPAPWHVSGKAKFKFLFIPIHVSFTVEWGKKTPQLSKKTIRVLELLSAEMKNTMNWTTNNSSSFAEDNEVVIEKLDNEDHLLIQPFESLSFNQNIVPLNRNSNDEKHLDLCNNAVPSDCNWVYIKNIQFDDECVSNYEKLENDFAPSLYYNMTQKEKLSSPSYEKHVSGFSVNVGNMRKTAQCEDKGWGSWTLDREYKITIRKTNTTSTNASNSNSTTTTKTALRKARLSKAKTSSIQTTTAISDEQKRSLELLIGSLQKVNNILITSIISCAVNNSFGHSKLGYVIKDKNAFDRYVKLLDEIKNK